MLPTLAMSASTDSTMLRDRDVRNRDSEVDLVGTGPLLVETREMTAQLNVIRSVHVLVEIWYPSKSDVHQKLEEFATDLLVPTPIAESNSRKVELATAVNSPRDNNRRRESVTE